MWQRYFPRKILDKDPIYLNGLAPHTVNSLERNLDRIQPSFDLNGRVIAERVNQNFSNPMLIDAQQFKTNMGDAGYSNSDIKRMESIGVINYLEFIEHKEEVDKIFPPNTKKAKKLVRMALAASYFNDPNLVRGMGNVPGAENILEFVEMKPNDICMLIQPGCSPNDIEEMQKFYKENIGKWLVDARKKFETLQPNQNPFELPEVMIQSDDGCSECEDYNSLFSPGVYLLNLADFVVDTLKFSHYNDLEKRLYQKIDTISFYEDVYDEVNYIELTNIIFENFYKDVANVFTRTPQANWRNIIYDRFRKGDFPYLIFSKKHLMTM